MTEISDVIGFKFKNDPKLGIQPGVQIVDDIILTWPDGLGDIPDGELPSQTDIDTWTAEFEFDKLITDHRFAISVEMNGQFESGILWTFNQGEDQFAISLNTGMRETLSAIKQLLDNNIVNPHGGFIWSNGVEIRKPDQGDLSDVGVDEICTFAGQWALAINRIAIQEKISLQSMDLSQLQAYDPLVIDWTVTWDVVEHPDWIDNLVIRNP